MEGIKDEAYYNSLDKRSKEYKNWNKSQEGLGDKVANITKAVGIKPCEACKKRQAKLNHIGHDLKYLFSKSNEFKESDKELWKQFRDNQSTQLSKEEINLIIRLSKEVLNVSIKACASCSSKVYEKWITRLNTVYDA